VCLQIVKPRSADADVQTPDLSVDCEPFVGAKRDDGRILFDENRRPVPPGIFAHAIAWLRPAGRTLAVLHVVSRPEGEFDPKTGYLTYETQTVDATQVDWDTEQACFDTFLRELARFYAPSALHDTRPPSDREDSEMTVDEMDMSRQQRNDNALEFSRHQLEHVLFPAMRRYAKFPKDSIKHITELADVKALYRTFERC
jgi:hypothetical protein